MALLIFIFFFFSFPLSCNAGQNLTTAAADARDTITNAAVDKLTNVRNTITDAAVDKLTHVTTNYPTVKDVAQKLHQTTNFAVDLASQTSFGQRIAESSVVQTISKNIPTETINRILYNHSSTQKNEEPLHRNGDSPNHDNTNQGNLSDTILENDKSSKQQKHLLDSTAESSKDQSNLSDSTRKDELLSHQNKQESYGKVSFSVENVPPGTQIPANVFRNYPVAVMKAIKKINKEATNVEDILPKEPHYMDFQLNGLTRDRITVRISWKAEQREAGHQILKRCRFILTEMRKEYASKGYRMLKIDAEDGIIIITCKITQFKLVPVPKRFKKKKINRKNN